MDDSSTVAMESPDAAGARPTAHSQGRTNSDSPINGRCNRAEIWRDLQFPRLACAPCAKFRAAIRFPVTAPTCTGLSYSELNYADSSHSAATRQHARPYGKRQHRAACHNERYDECPDECYGECQLRHFG